MGCCPDNCHCVWGLSCIFMGGFILCAAAVFTFFPAFMDIFQWGWYESLCWLWAGLGAFMFVSGCFIHWFNLCPHKRMNGREYDDVTDAHCDGCGGAPIPYVMIDA